MNLSFTDLFNNKLENQESDSIDRRSDDDEQSDYKRDETGEHYLSEYRDRNANQNANQTNSQPSEAETEKNDRFSHKGHFYDQDNHDRFDRIDRNAKTNND